MNVMLQIGIGLIPATIIVLIVLFIRKNFKKLNIVSTCITAGLCLLFLVMGTVNTIKNNSSLQVSEEDMYKMIYGLVENGSYERADELLEQVSNMYGYTKECSIIRARIKALTNEFKASQMILSNISSDYIEKEKDYINKVVLASRIDTAVDNMLKKIGQSTSENDAIRAEADDIISNNKIFNAINESVTKKFGDISKDRMYSIGNLISRVDKCYEEYKLNGYVDDDELKRVTFVVNNILNEMSSLSSLPYYREARLKVNILNSDYDKIAKQIDNNASYKELMVISQLYINGFIKSTNFPDYFKPYNEEDLKKVKEQMQYVYKINIDKRSTRDNNNLKEKIEAFNNIIDNIPLVSLKNNIVNNAENSENLSNASKLYYQAAKIDNYLGNNNLAEDNLSKSFDTIGNCDDFNFAKPVYEIVNIIKGENDSENIKNVSDYVDIIEENSMPIYVAIGDSEGYEQKQEFNNTVTDYVSKAKAAINIGLIDYSNFPQIEARVQISSDYINENTDLKSILEVYDCGVKIDDYTIEKVKIDGSNVQLVCDNSGSMDGSISMLKNAVQEYVGYNLEDEDISIVAFDSKILFTYGFGSSDSELQEAISKFYAGGGTNIYGTLVELIEKFPSEKNKNNIIILLTDGNDGNTGSITNIMQNIGQAAKDKNIVVYTLGIGSSVDTDYLTTIAEATGGSFVYVNDISSLSVFYDFIHEQIKNQYVIKYTAKDTLTSFDRSLEVKIPDLGISTIKYYSLSEEKLDSYNSYYADGLSVSGFVPRTIYKDANEKDRTIQIKGTGFSNNDTIYINLEGNLSYTLYPKFVDSETYQVTLNAGMPEGSYKATISINGRKSFIENALLVIDGELDKIEFGPYVFYATNIIHSNDVYTLSGAVNLNNWLNFKGDIVITGALDNTKVQMTDNNGSYVYFNKDTAKGLASTFAKNAWIADIPSFGTISLYNTYEDYTDDSYTVDKKSISNFSIKNFMGFNNPFISLYPDRVRINSSESTTKLPFQDVIIQSFGVEDPFKIDIEVNGFISSSSIGFKEDLVSENNDTIFKTSEVFGQIMPVDLNNLEIHIDTLSDEFSFKFSVKVPFANDEAVGLELGWKEGKIDTMMFTADFDVNTMIGNVPVTFNTFEIGVTGAADSNEFGNAADILGYTLVGRFNVEIASISSIFKNLDSYIGNVALFTMPETEVKLRLKNFMLSAKAELKFLDEIKLVEAEIKIGTIEDYYEPMLLESKKQDVYGLYARCKQGFMWSIKDCNIDISGTGEVNLHNKFMGLKYTGQAKINIRWWLFETDIIQEGNILFGLYFPDNAGWQLTLRTKIVDDKGKVSGNMFYISANGIGSDDNYLK